MEKRIMVVSWLQLGEKEGNIYGCKKGKCLFVYRNLSEIGIDMEERERGKTVLAKELTVSFCILLMWNRGQ